VFIFEDMLSLQFFIFNPLQENTYVLWDETKECVIIDPGCYERDEKEDLTDFIKANNLTPKYLLNTHCHVDHVLGNQFIKRTYNIPLLVHPIEQEVLRMVKIYAPIYGFVAYEESEPDQLITEKDTVTFGNTELSILFLPGHSPGSIAFVEEKTKTVIAGDVLFQRSIGRSDLPGGHHQTLINSIKNTLFKLEDSYKVYPGHGDLTTIGEEKKYNPYLT
jgi:hydroxyacylglutathione hydrolase